MTVPWAAVIGIGNELRRDDGIGPAVAAEIQHRDIPGVRVSRRIGSCAGSNATTTDRLHRRGA